ncbi:MAG: winged helix-turn-helix transcriptional regulator [Candidatus Heimdallarchaeota archaeon]
MLNERGKPKPTSFRALAEKTGLSISTISDRRNKLRDQGFALN